MKRRWLALLLILAFIVLSGCSSKGTIHKLWDIDVSTMSADQIMDYLKQKKGIETISRPDGFFSDPLSELTLYGYPYQLSFDSFDGENTISLDFSYFFDNESSLWDIRRQEILMRSFDCGLRPLLGMTAETGFLRKIHIRNESLACTGTVSSRFP